MMTLFQSDHDFLRFPEDFIQYEIVICVLANSKQVPHLDQN